MRTIIMDYTKMSAFGVCFILFVFDTSRAETNYFPSKILSKLNPKARHEVESCWREKNIQNGVAVVFNGISMKEENLLGEALADTSADFWSATGEAIAIVELQQELQVYWKQIVAALEKNPYLMQKIRSSFSHIPYLFLQNWIVILENMDLRNLELSENDLEMLAQVLSQLPDTLLTKDMWRWLSSNINLCTTDRLEAVVEAMKLCHSQITMDMLKALGTKGVFELSEIVHHGKLYAFKELLKINQIRYDYNGGQALHFDCNLTVNSYLTLMNKLSPDDIKKFGTTVFVGKGDLQTLDPVEKWKHSLEKYRSPYDAGNFDEYKDGTQMVWTQSQWIGCSWKRDHDEITVLCLFSPGGNEPQNAKTFDRYVEGVAEEANEPNLLEDDAYVSITGPLGILLLLIGALLVLIAAIGALGATASLISGDE